MEEIYWNKCVQESKAFSAFCHFYKNYSSLKHRRRARGQEQEGGGWSLPKQKFEGAQVPLPHFSAKVELI